MGVEQAPKEKVARRWGEWLFRFRFGLHGAIYVVGFLAPWDRWVDLDHARTAWLALAAWMSEMRWLSFTGGTVAVLVAGIVCALVGAGLRTWGTAYLGGGVMQARAMQGEKVMADGPYRRVRNPLYLGTWIHTLALAMLMPPSGAVFAIVAVAGLELLLIRGEEEFLAGKLGPGYAAYRAAVPRLLPRLRAPNRELLATGGIRPRLWQATVAEIYFWGVAASFMALGWRYNAFLLIRCVLISVGVSMVLRAVPMREGPAESL